MTDITSDPEIETMTEAEFKAWFERGVFPPISGPLDEAANDADKANGGISQPVDKTEEAP